MKLEWRTYFYGKEHFLGNPGVNYHYYFIKIRFAFFRLWNEIVWKALKLNGLSLKFDKSPTFSSESGKHFRTFFEKPISTQIMGNRVCVCTHACGCYEVSDLKTLSHISMFHMGFRKSIRQWRIIKFDGSFRSMLVITPILIIQIFVFNKPIEIQHINVKLRAFPLRMYLLCVQSYMGVFEFLSLHTFCV